ncbi:MAG: 4-hydroxythreonine-4-phosphate dehydrogenase [uncultured Sulfurimonas sp.]|nr:MAG: 4-hydroxythreonine-4-phosphate dehydrogenase [uncultured Sulfurimonas sp.]CAI6164027.1 MAG: 4-hydroxythreonine-4-phosphate dehydrogenase [uncultured Sulfurimonas sp.]
MNKPTLAISIGDLNGVGIEIILKAHEEISTLCHPIYCINKTMIDKASKLLDITLPQDIQLHNVVGDFSINAGLVDALSGRYSYDSFMAAIKLCEEKKADGVVTMPIHKEAWMMAGLEYKGHTDLLRQHFDTDAIMMLGCPEMFVALVTEHIPLRDVTKMVKYKMLKQFLLNLQKEIPKEKVAVLGINPHAGDNGVLGHEDMRILKAIKSVNKQLGWEQFFGPIVPDVAFTPHFRKDYHYYVAMYHDQGLGPLKALHFDESVNISLNLPIVRTSVDHGTAFDIAYQGKAKTLSYINAIKSAIQLNTRKIS